MAGLEGRGRGPARGLVLRACRSGRARGQRLRADERLLLVKRIRLGQHCGRPGVLPDVLIFVPGFMGPGRKAFPRMSPRRRFHATRVASLATLRASALYQRRPLEGLAQPCTRKDDVTGTFAHSSEDGAARPSEATAKGRPSPARTYRDIAVGVEQSSEASVDVIGVGIVDERCFRRRRGRRGARRRVRFAVDRLSVARFQR